MIAGFARQYVTADEFRVHPAAAGHSELVRGEIRMMTPAFGPHGLVAGEIFAAIKAFVDLNKLGVCFPDNTGFLLPGLGDTVRSPDAAYVHTDRLPAGGFVLDWVGLSPDLVVEVLSASESKTDLEEKLADYREAGTRFAWVIDCQRRGVSVRVDGADERWFEESDDLDGGEVLPGFTMPVARLFMRLAK